MCAANIELDYALQEVYAADGGTAHVVSTSVILDIWNCDIEHPFTGVFFNAIIKI